MGKQIQEKPEKQQQQLLQQHLLQQQKHKPIDLNALSIFTELVETGSFTATAEKLGVAKAKISIQISRLEQQLGTSLFVRTTRKMHLTEAGQLLYAQAQPLLLGLHDAVEHLASEHSELRGVLRISASVNHAAQSVAPALAKFSMLHPHLKIDLRTGDRISDVVGEGIDLAFRVGWLKDSSNRAIQLSNFRQFVVAAPAYLKKYGVPQTPAQLSEHEWIALSLLPTPLTWQFSDVHGKLVSIHMKSRLQVDAPGALRCLLEEGAGISILDQMTAEKALQEGRLVQVLADYSLPGGGVFAVLPPGRHVPAKVRVFLDFFKQYISA